MATGLRPLDRLLGGGLHRGQLHELIGRRSSGRLSMVNAILAAATGSGEAAALVDLGDSFDISGAAAAGVAMERLLWVRPGHLKEALVSAEMLLHGGFPLLILDLGQPPLPGGRGAEAAWLRLARTARSRRAALLVSSPYRASGTAAEWVLEAGRANPVWSGRERSPTLLSGIGYRLLLRKCRYHRPGESRRFILSPSEAIAADRLAGQPPQEQPGRTDREPPVAARALAG
jgi:hypothetical protein